MKIVTRFAPSPTGYVHVGGLRTVLYNYLFAKQNDGVFMLRIEDTDQTRLVEGSVQNIIDVLNKVGLTPDEGPNKPGKVGPYIQSERLDIYKKYADELIKNGMAYYCFCSSERIENLRKEQEELGLPTKYDKKCRFLSDDEIKNNLEKGLPYTIRMKVPEGRKVVFNDLIRGKIEIESKDIDEQVLIKTDGFPTYHLANVVDDHLMGVTHVIRGEEWVPSTPKHILLYEAFGWTAPEFAHLSLLLGKDKKKLSKRQGDVSVESYLQKGYLVEALINYIAFLGWNPKSTKEFFTLDELISEFKVENINRAGAVFDIEKLDWYNSKYMTNMESSLLYDKFCEWCEEYDNDFLKNTLLNFSREYNIDVLNEIKTKIKKFDEFKENTKFIYNFIGVLDKNLFLNEKMKVENLEIAKNSLKIAREILESFNGNEKDFEAIKQTFVEGIAEKGQKNGQILWPVRVALTGEQFSPGALEMILILGKEESIKRIKKSEEEL